ncbi:MAG TPA: hypothetical protein VFS04_00675 [Alphaproteobacteria bacterium]|nr:hypothetical protein [Alphaproteobacteria bacterium]
MLAQLRHFSIAAWIAAAMLSAPTALAGGVDLPRVDVAKIKDVCSKGSKPFWDTGVTSDRMQGSMEYRECLKSALLAYWRQMSPDKESEDRFAKQLDDFTNPFMRAVADIFQGNKACPCGTEYNDYYSLFTADIYELLLRGMAEATGSH